MPSVVYLCIMTTFPIGLSSICVFRDEDKLQSCVNKVHDWVLVWVGNRLNFGVLCSTLNVIMISLIFNYAWIHYSSEEGPQREIPCTVTFSWQSFSFPLPHPALNYEMSRWFHGEQGNHEICYLIRNISFPSPYSKSSEAVIKTNKKRSS